MSSTSVNDVGALIGSLNASVQAQMTNRISNMGSGDTSSNSPSFDSILNAGIQNSVSATESGNYTGLDMANKNPDFNQKKNSDRIAGEDKRDAGKTSGTDKKQEKVSGNRDKSVAGKNGSDEMSTEDIEKAGEALSTAVSELLERIQNILQITPEEAEELLNQMGMSVEDMLNSEDLSAFALQAMGAEDSLALLTDESKYEQFQEISNALSDIMSAESGVGEMSVEELRALLDKMKADKEDTQSGQVTLNEVTDRTESDKDGAAVLSKPTDKAGAERDGSSEMENQGNTEGFFQNTNAPVNVPITADSTGVNTADAQQIANQIMDYLRSNVKADTQTLEMQLHPASLGNIQISLTNKGGDISASFVAQNEQVKAVLETQLIQLQQRFEEQGIKVTSIEVSVGTNSFSENLEQQGHREEEQEAQRPRRVRRLQLSPGMDIPEALEEEDKLAAQMLAANGGTMDLQA